MSMRYVWTSVAIFIIWVSSSILLVQGPLPDPEIFFLYLMLITVILSYIGFKSV